MSSSSYLNLPETGQFNGGNFQTFGIILELTIAGKGLQGYLDGTIPRPADSFTVQNAVVQVVTTPSASTSASTALLCLLAPKQPVPQPHSLLNLMSHLPNGI